MNFNFSDTLDELRKSLFKGAAAAFVYALIVRIFAPKPTSVEVEDGIPAEIYTLGKRGNPKIVYVSTKKRHINIMPAVFMLAAAIGVSAAKKELEETITVPSND